MIVVYMTLEVLMSCINHMRISQGEFAHEKHNTTQEIEACTDNCVIHYDWCHEQINVRQNYVSTPINK